MKLLRCLSMDPPWPEYGGGRRGAQEHYKLQRVEDMPTFIRQGLHESSAVVHPDGCHVWMWTLGRYVVTGQAAWILQRLGARPVKLFPWVKTGEPVDDEQLTEDNLRLSLGQYGRSAHEFLMFGVIGRLPQLPSGRSESDVIVAPVPTENGKRIHSRKPPEAYAKIEAISPGPRLELFARTARDGWDRWGFEAPPQAVTA